MLRANAANVHVEILEMRVRLIVIREDLTIREHRLHAFAEMIEFLNEIHLVVPSRCRVLVAMRASIHVHENLTLIPRLFGHWQVLPLLFLLPLSFA